MSKLPYIRRQITICVRRREPPRLLAVTVQLGELGALLSEQRPRRIGRPENPGCGHG